MSYAFDARDMQTQMKKKTRSSIMNVYRLLWHTTKNSTESCEMSDTWIEFLCFITTVECFVVKRKKTNVWKKIHFKWTSLDVKCNRESWCCWKKRANLNRSVSSYRGWKKKPWQTMHAFQFDRHQKSFWKTCTHKPKKKTAPKICFKSGRALAFKRL